MATKNRERRAAAPAAVNRLILAWLGSPVHGSTGTRMCGLRYTASDGSEITLPVVYAREGSAVVVLAGQADRKRWWRAFRHARKASVLLDGRWRPATGHVATGPARAAAARRYRNAFPAHTVPDGDELVVFTLHDGTALVPPARRVPRWRTWFAWVTVGEFIGFATPAGMGALFTSWPAVATAGALIAAGAVEGAVLGWAQVHVLGRALPALRRARFVTATAAAAALAYAIGLVPSWVGEGLPDIPVWALVLGAIVGGVALLATIGTAQWLVLREVLPRSASWILTTAGAWAAGLLMFTAVATPLWHAGQPVALVAAIGAGAGLLMAATVAALTGLAVLRLLGATSPGP